MRIAWIQDLDPMVTTGGAELNDRTHIVEGLRRGHDIRIIVLSTNVHDLQDSFDLVVISNSMGLGIPFYQEFKKRQLPYVIFAHDYGPWVCRYRLLYPMQEKCKTFCYLRERWAPILEDARLIIWLSPLHRWAWLWAYPGLRDHPYALIPSAVNLDQFFIKNTNHRGGVITVNTMVAFKGANNILAWAEKHPDQKVTLVGGNPGNYSLLSNIQDRGWVPYGQMNDLYNQYECLLHLPDHIMPFDRTVAEAYLAGCRIIGNRNIGALSWPAFKKGRDAVAKMCAEAPHRFWRAIEKWDA